MCAAKSHVRFTNSDRKADIPPHKIKWLMNLATKLIRLLSIGSTRSSRIAENQHLESNFLSKKSLRTVMSLLKADMCSHASRPLVQWLATEQQLP
jgi:hypothetical protein